VPRLLRIGNVVGGIDPGVYRAAFEFDLRGVPALATINNVQLVTTSLAPPVQRGHQVLSACFGDGVISASDVNLTLDSLVLDSAAPFNTAYDVTGIFNGFYAIGATWLGFSARQDPLGQCVMPFFGSCSTVYIGPGTEGVTSGPQLVIDYTAYVPPPPPDIVPEPATWAMLIAGFGLVGAAARQRRLAHR